MTGTLRAISGRVAVGERLTPFSERAHSLRSSGQGQQAADLLHQQASACATNIAYLDQNLPVSHEVNVKAIERYIVWPAQATAYKIGMRRILELRADAKQRLGTNFDIRGFHQAVLANGALPLEFLEDVVERWIREVEG